MIAQLVSMSSGPNGCRFDSRVEPKIVKTKITNPISLIGYKSNQNQNQNQIKNTTSANSTNKAPGKNKKIKINRKGSTDPGA